jgi:hypothetical protein
MATLLMIESWLQSTGQVLPPLLDRLGHEYVLVTRDPGTYGAGSKGVGFPPLVLQSRRPRVARWRPVTVAGGDAATGKNIALSCAFPTYFSSCTRSGRRLHHASSAAM